MPDYSVLKGYQGADANKPNQYTVKFVQTVQEKLVDLDYRSNTDAETIHDKLCKAINHVVETLPKRLIKKEKRTKKRAFMKK